MNCNSHSVQRGISFSAYGLGIGVKNLKRALGRLCFVFCASVYAGLFLFYSTLSALVADDLYGAPVKDISVHLDKLVSSYPDWIVSHSDQYLNMKDKVRFAISDHRTDKTFNELIDHPDIDDMFYVPYPAGSEPKQPPKNFDPGRVRFEPLFAAMYGDCRRGEVTSKLRTIAWLPAHKGGKGGYHHCERR